MNTEIDETLTVQDVIDIIGYLEEYKNIVVVCNSYDIARIDNLILRLSKRRLQ